MVEDTDFISNLKQPDKDLMSKANKDIYLFLRPILEPIKENLFNMSQVLLSHQKLDIKMVDILLKIVQESDKTRETELDILDCQRTIMKFSKDNLKFIKFLDCINYTNLAIGTVTFVLVFYLFLRSPFIMKLK